MKKTILILSFVLMVYLLLMGCGAYTPTTTTEPAAAEPTQPPAMSMPEEATKEIAKTEELTTTIPAIRLLPPGAKPPLDLAGPEGMDFDQVIGYIFPDGTIGIKASPMMQPWELPDGFTAAGVIEIGKEAGMAGIYVVALDLSSFEPVMGVLLPLNDKDGDGIPDGDYDGDGIPDEVEKGIPVDFQAFPQDLNSERGEWESELPPPVPAISSISAEGVCFLFSVEDASGYTQVTRYCSSSAELSVRANFPKQFEVQMSNLNNSIDRLQNGGYPDEAQIKVELTISEMEDPSKIEDCAYDEEKCGADIVGAPNASFWEDYERVMGETLGYDVPGYLHMVIFSPTSWQEEPQGFAVTAGVVKILQEIALPGEEPVVPGDYWVRIWFDRQEEFIGATIRGLTADGKPVEDQPIAAVPASYVNADGTDEIVSWISAWRLARWCCFWQSNCP